MMGRFLRSDDFDREEIRTGVDCINNRLANASAIFRLHIDKAAEVVVIVPTSMNYLRRDISSSFNLSDEFYDMVIGYFAKLKLKVIFNNTGDRFWFTEN